jgi:hypothetical protein
MDNILKDLKSSLAKDQEQLIFKANTHRQIHNFEKRNSIFIVKKNLLLIMLMIQP